jgi:hypothetical protein
MLIKAALLSSLLLGATPLLASAATCSEAQAVISGCTSVDAGTDGQQVDLHGEVTAPGAGGGADPVEPPTGEVVVQPPAAAPQQPPAPEPDGIIIPRRPLQPFPAEEETDEPLPEVSIDDLASFAPAAGPAAGEPAGWGIVGLDTNFYARSGAQILEGELLGRPAAVRFTPIAWHWDYGDGSRATTSTPGAPWGSGTEFEPTVTSHRYGAVGTFRVRLAVEFGAEFRFAEGDWLPVGGSVTANAEPLGVRIGTADTVLVERDCEAGSGPGC